jgi:hypothetical protein
LTDSTPLTSLPFGMSSRKTGSRDSLPVVFLEIQQGRTAFPYRPVQGNRFLIGSASCCDLCLGSQSVPQLHSLLHIDKDEVVLESVADFPLLKINGEIERSKTLCDGDVIDIGRFQLVARISPSFNASSIERRTAERLENVHTILEPVDDDLSIDDDLSVEQETDIESVDEEKSIEVEVEKESLLHEELSIHDEVGDEITDDELNIPESIVDEDGELSAEELVDLIESEQQIVEQFEERQQIGADALIQTVRKRAESLDTRSEDALSDDAEQESVVFDNESDNEKISDPSQNLDSMQSDNNVEDALPEDVQLIIHSEVDKVLEQLHGLSEELDRRTERLLMRETGFAEAAACLLDAQYKLTTQLEKLVDRLSSLPVDQSDGKTPYRAVA